MNTTLIFYAGFHWFVTALAVALAYRVAKKTTQQENAVLWNWLGLLILAETSTHPAVDTLKVMATASRGFHVGMFAIATGYFVAFFILTCIVAIALQRLANRVYTGIGWYPDDTLFPEPLARALPFWLLAWVARSPCESLLSALVNYNLLESLSL